MENNALQLLPPLEKAWADLGDRIEKNLNEKDDHRSRIDALNEANSYLLNERGKVRAAMDALEDSDSVKVETVSGLKMAPEHAGLSPDQIARGALDFEKHNSHQLPHNFDDGVREDYDEPEDGANSPMVVRPNHGEAIVTVTEGSDADVEDLRRLYPDLIDGRGRSNFVITPPSEQAKEVSPKEVNRARVRAAITTMQWFSLTDEQRNEIVSWHTGNPQNRFLAKLEDIVKERG